MQGIEEIEEAIDRLPPEDFRRIAQWLREREELRASANLDDAYHNLALDADREREALDWSEGIVSDVSPERDNASR